MEEQYRYMIKWDRITPVLLRLDLSEKQKAYILESCEVSKGLAWVYTPELDDILNHPEHFPEYTEITDEEAAEIERQFEAKNEETEKKRNAICIRRSRKQTEDGPAEVVTYSKASKWRYFSTKEYVEMLGGYLAGKRVAFQRSDYNWYDEWGYPKQRSITRKENLKQMIGDGADEIVTRFSDPENKYILRAPFGLHTIELETVPKKKKAKKLNSDN